MKDQYKIDDLAKILDKKRKINSKAKGSKFVRDLCKFFNERFKSKDFCPTPGSGAFATTHTLPDYLKIYGDIICPKNFKFCIEAKSGYNKESLFSLLNKKSEFWKFINQVNKDSKQAKKLPLLIFKQNRQKPLCFINLVSAYSFKEFFIIKSSSYGDWFCFTLDDLFTLPDSVFLE